MSVLFSNTCTRLLYNEQHKAKLSAVLKIWIMVTVGSVNRYVGRHLTDISTESRSIVGP